ncbi:TIGR02099 family protein [Alteromonas sp. LMIT006]|uniref:YhdP family protein n=1 Tax=Alteromonadaceae TaxID=72275 RepID=UPI0020CA396C|nr:YhdP family protein [Alteromonas sp. LMIT006]UTP73357.1 TIGR02099 family protein [Alteromonas sp. LMIT006]
MSESNTSHFLRKSIAFMWQSFALCVVLVAVLLSAIRLSLPHVDSINFQLSQHLSERLNAQVTIEQLKGSWDNQGPTLELVNLSILDNSQNAFMVEHLTISVDVFESFAQMTLITHEFALRNAAVTLLPQPIQDQTTSNDDVAALVPLLKTLFIEQLTYFSIDNLNIQFLAEGYEQNYRIAELKWLNRNNQHTGIGRILSADSQSELATLSIALTGGAHALEGQIYFAADTLPVRDLLPIKFREHVAETSLLSSSAWVDIQSNQIIQVTGHVAPTDIQIQNNEQSIIVKNEEFNWVMRPERDYWSVSLNEIDLSVNDIATSTTLAGRLYTNGQSDFVLTTPIPMAMFAPILAIINPKAAPIELTGELAEVGLYWLSDKEQAGFLRFANAGWEAQEHVGINNLNLDTYWHRLGALTAIRSTIDAVDGMLFTGPHTLAEDLEYSELSADIFANIVEDTFVLAPSTLTLKSELTDLFVSAQYNTRLQLHASLEPDTVKNITALLPTQLMGKQTYRYLMRALDTENQTGQVKSATLLWDGVPTDFPFADNSGVFQAQVVIEEADFVFAPDWPMLENLALTLDFVNADLFMYAPSATLGDVAVSDMYASIPGLNSQSVLTIDAQGSGSGFAVSQVMQQSSLAGSLGKVLSENIIVSNVLSTQLNLSIPLSGSKVDAQGSVTFDDNYVFIKNIDTQLKNVSGTLAFDNSNISAPTLTARLLEQMIDLDLSLSQQDSGYQAKIGLSGDFDSALLAEQLNPSYAQLTSGSVPWQAHVDLEFPTNGDFAYAVQLDANLLSSEWYLPPPFANARELMLTLTGDAKFSQVTTRLDNSVHFTGALPHAEMQFSRAHLRLGNASPLVNMGTGFSISAALDELDVLNWYSAINHLLDSEQARGNSLFAPPERIFIETDALHIAGQTLHNVGATVKQSDNNWQIELSSDETRAEASLYNDWLGTGVVINAQYVDLPTWSSATESAQIEWQAMNLPPIRFNCNKCRILGNDFGKIVMHTSPNLEGVAIDEFRIEHPEGKLFASGQWRFSGAERLAETQLEGVLDAKDFGQFLKRFNFDSGIVDSSADFDFAMRWTDTPMDFNFENLYGQVDWSLSDGYLTEVSDKGSRIFTLVSLDSLVRKLSLDFRDVFAQGFFYDEISGTMKIEQGVASTQDTLVDGGAGEIEITGFTDLVAQELNYNVSFTPDVTGNLPALMYFMVNPPTAIAALAVNQVLTEAKVFSNINYSVTGTFAEPIIEELGRTSADIQLPARLGAELPEETDRPISELDKQGIPLAEPPSNNGG